MPRTRAAARKRATARSQKEAQEKASEVAEVTPKEQLLFVIRDLEAQIPRIIDSACKKYEREALKSVRQLPDKASLPPEIYNMPLSEFIRRGNDMEPVMQSLRDDKMKEFVSEGTKENEPENTSPVILMTRMRTRSIATTTKKKEGPLIDDIPSTATRTRGRSKRAALTTAAGAQTATAALKEVQPDDFTTPALRTRSQAAIPPSTAKRQPKQLEEIEVMMRSKDTGSPLNEKDTMETLLLGMVDECFKNVLPTLSKRAQGQASKAIEQKLSEMKERIRQEGDIVSVVTPMVGSTRARRNQ